MQKWEVVHNMWRQDVTNLPLTIKLIEQLFAAQAWQQCEELFTQLSDELRVKPEIRAKHIEWLIHQNQLSLAADEAQVLCSLTNDHPIALHYLALTHYLNGDLASILALQSIEQLTDETTILIARAMYHQGQLSESLQRLKSIELAEAYGLSAMLYLDLDQLDLCVANAQKALAIVPNQMDAMLAKASYWVNQQQMLAAEPLIEQVLQLQPHSGRALSVKGQIEFFNMDIATATETFTKAVTFMPDHIGTWHLLAWCHYLSSQFDLAQQAFTTALNIDKNFAESHGGLAVVAIAMGDVTQAQHLSKIALRLNGQSFTGLYAQSLLEEHDGNPTKSTQIINGMLSQPSHLKGQTYRDMINTVINKRQVGSEI